MMAILPFSSLSICGQDLPNLRAKLLYGKNYTAFQQAPRFEVIEM
jgi:hypothetical protein